MTTPKRKPWSSELAQLRSENEDLMEQLRKERRRGDLLQIDLDLALGAIRDLRDWQQNVARRNGECR